jgi:hypothetical protein
MSTKLFILTLLICLPGVSFADQKAVANAAEKLTQALTQLQKTPGDKEVQERYLEAFPHTYKSFLDLFEPDCPLYDGYDYVDALYSLVGGHELEVGKLLVQLSKDAQYDADAPSYLQHATANFGSQHAKTFLALLKQLPVGKQVNLITFLADVENHGAYPEYQLIIDRLKALGEQTFAHKFETARARRSKQPHD